MLTTISLPDELGDLLGPEERLPQALTEAAVLELFREHRLSSGKAAELVVATPPRAPQDVADLLRRAEGAG